MHDSSPLPGGFLRPGAGHTRLTLLLLLFGLGGCASFPGRGGPTLEEEIRRIIDAPPLDQLHWGILIVDAGRSQTLFAHQPHKKFVPASNMKILSTATALSLLGPDYRFETKVWGVGRLDRERWRLEGDLVVRPVGDPTLSERFYPSAEAPLDSLAQWLWEAGVRSVSGSLVVDASAWDSTTVPGSWTVGSLTSRSGATGAALAIAEGVITAEITGGSEPGDPGWTRWWPETPTGFFHPAFVSVHPDSSLEWEAHYLPESRLIRMEGAIPAGGVDTLSLAQRDPEGVALQALLRALRNRGISVEGGARVSHAPGESLGSGRCVTGWAQDEVDPHAAYLPGCTDGEVLATLRSPPMGEIVEAILEPSQNWMTEQLVHALGLIVGETGSWQEGFRIQSEFLTGTVGVDSLDLHFRDGSGLSSYNLVTPRALVSLLEYMRRSSHGRLFRLALAEPGEEAGTLRSRLSGLEGRVFGKTGTISHVNSLSGYLLTEDGRELVFSILSNGSGLSSRLVRDAIDGIVRAASRR